MPKYLLLAHYRGGPEPRHPFPPHGATNEIGRRLVERPAPPRTALKHESRLARGGFRIAGAGFEPATFGL